MSRRIAILISTWNNNFLRELLSGVEKRAGEKLELYIFNAYDEAMESIFYLKEKEIFSLPIFEQFDGILLALNSIDAATLLHNEITACRTSGKPVVSIDQQFEGIPFCGIDNYKSMYKLVDHMIEVHGCRVFNYVGGPKNHQEDIIRFKAFKDCLDIHGIKFDEERERHYKFLHSDGAAAFRDFHSKGFHLADCTVCANDYMAIGYTNEAIKSGLRVPQDIRVTGFDNLQIGQMFLPSITSVNRNWVQLGYDAMDRLIAMMDGARPEAIMYTEGFVRQNESCGCGNRVLEEDYMEICSQRADDTKKVVNQSYARQALCTSANLEQFMYSLTVARNLLKCPKMAIFLTQSFFDGDYNTDKIGYSDDFNVYMEEGKEVANRVDSLIPKAWENNKDKYYLFSSLHFGNQTYGYCVMPLSVRLLTEGIHRVLMESLSLALENICHRLSLDGMNEQLRKLYVQDPLTGLLNRFGYAAQANGFFEKNMGRVYMVYMDVDNLKKFNDEYGHAIGDLAIKGVAEAIDEAFDEDEIKVRMGGDEFLVMGVFVSVEEIEEKLKRVEDYLKQYSIDEEMPMPLEASMGYVWNEKTTRDESLEPLVKRADKRMYEIKQQHKKAKAEKAEIK